MSEKRVLSIFCFVVCCMSIFLVPFSAHASNIIELGTGKNLNIDCYDVNDSSYRGMGVNVSVIPIQPTLLNYDFETSNDTSTIRFLNSSGNSITGTLTQSGNANVVTNLAINLRYSDSHSSTTTNGTVLGNNNSVGIYSPTSASYPNTISGLKFGGLPTSASIDYSNTTNGLYLYEEKFDVFIRLRNYSGDVYQFNNTPAQQALGIDVSHITGEIVGGEFSQVDNFGEMGIYRLFKSGTQTMIGITVPNDYVYSSRITLAPGMTLTGHFVLSTYVFRTTVTTDMPVINSLSYTGADSCRQYNGVNPSVLWNLYYINLKLDSINSVPSNVSSNNSISQSVNSDMNNIHNTESSYFQANQQALEASGIGNFSFDNNVVSGFSTVRTDFLELWYGLGDFRLIFVFTLLIALATFVIRHNPSLRANRALALGTSVRHNSTKRRFRT